MNNQQGNSRALMDWLQDHEAEMFSLLERIVNIDSGSHDKEGVDQVQAVLQQYLEAAGIETQIFPQEKSGNCLLAKVPCRAESSSQSGYILLMGHADTVFPKGTVSERPFTVKDNIAYGPGVADMKSGLVMNTFIALAFNALGGHSAPIYVLYTGDEEIASPESRTVIQEVAAGASMVLNAEPGRPTGNVVTERKGAMFLDFEVHGKAAHAGTNHKDGISAIDALAHKIIDLHQATDLEQGITANVGVVTGGLSVNTVAPRATAQVDVRYPSSVNHATLRERIGTIIEQSGNTQGATAAITHEGSFLPMSPSPANQQLFTDYKNSAVQVGLHIEGEFAGGSADSGLTSIAGIPTLCATGPVGGFYHTVKEYCELNTIVPRAQAAALTILARSEID